MVGRLVHYPSTGLKRFTLYQVMHLRSGQTPHAGGDRGVCPCRLKRERFPQYKGDSPRRDAAGNRTSRTETTPAQHGTTVKAAAYSYDAIYQLTQATVNGSTTDSDTYDREPPRQWFPVKG